MFACLRALRVYVLPCSRAWRAFVLVCLTYMVAMMGAWHAQHRRTCLIRFCLIIVFVCINQGFTIKGKLLIRVNLS